jgi:TPR repeat protein
MFEDLAKNRDFPIAYYMQGLMLNRGLGVQKDAEAAFACFKTASERGVVRAYYDLSTFYDSGKVHILIY